MKFTSLSEAIKFYQTKEVDLATISPYSSLASELQLVPQNTNYIDYPAPNVITYGKSIWGIGKIIDISTPEI
jgi:hypothetical protein